MVSILLFFSIIIPKSVTPMSRPDFRSETAAPPLAICSERELIKVGEASAQSWQSGFLQLFSTRHDSSFAGVGCWTLCGDFRRGVWRHSLVQGVATGMPTPLGTIMLAALPTMLGLQLLLAFVAFDVTNVPRRQIHVDLAD